MAESPNIVLIMTDTQGADLVGAYGKGRELKTPNLDKLSEEGVRFTRAYTSCPLCSPARAGIFTGMMPVNTGVYTNGPALGEDVRTMGQIFSSAGYDCGYVGKWHLDGHDYFGNGLCPEGWDADYWFDGKNYLDSLSDEEKILWRKGLTSEEDLRAHGIDEEFCWAHRSGTRAIDFIGKKRDNPFLLVVSYDEPHHPWTCPPGYLREFADYEYALGDSAFDSLEDKPAHYREWAESVFGVSTPSPVFRNPFYFACNSYADYEAGRVIDCVKRVCPDNTIIIYTADHGEMHGAHRLNIKGPAAFEEITHIPFIFNGPPSLVTPGVNDTVVSHLDLIPTMLDYAGLPAADNLEGESLVPHVRDGRRDDNRTAFMEYTRYETGHDGFGAFQPNRSIVRGSWKLTLHLMDRDELYNLETDPEEMVNLIEDPASAGIRDELHGLLIEHMDAIRDSFRGSHWVRRYWSRSERDDWSGPERPKPDNGSGIPFYDYNNGVPMEGVQERDGAMDTIMKDK